MCSNYVYDHLSYHHGCSDIFGAVLNHKILLITVTMETQYWRLSSIHDMDDLGDFHAYSRILHLSFRQHCCRLYQDFIFHKLDLKYMVSQ